VNCSFNQAALRKFILILFPFVLLFISCKEDDKDPDIQTGNLQLSSIRAGAQDLSFTADNSEVAVDKPIVLSFSAALDSGTVPASIQLQSADGLVELDFSYLDDNRTISAKPKQNLQNNKAYTLSISGDLKGEKGESFSGFSLDFTTVPAKLELVSLQIGGKNGLGNERITDIPLELTIQMEFSIPLNAETIAAQNFNLNGKSVTPLSFTLSNENKTVTLTGSNDLIHFEKYTFTINKNIKGIDGESFTGFSKDFYTAIDPEPKFPLISDDELLTLVQKQTFKYFWDFGHPVSGMARERNSSGDVVTTGGTGFGLMAIIVGIERGFITRDEGVARLHKIISFLETADRFHGVWPHWLNGATGKVQPFSPNDDGGDLVETSFLIQGMLAVRQYLSSANSVENELIQKINTLWEGVEWDWYTKGGEDVLYWHWSPRVEWEMNHQIRGYNEALITYFLAAASPTHPIEASVYHNGWAQNGAIANGKTFLNYTLPLGFDYGGPLFFAHYSFLGLNPQNLTDSYANYWDQNVNHTLINRAYSIQNPKNFVGYSEQMWGLTASDNHEGYSAHSPTNDLGVITPTAAISSIPYTPEYSMEAIRFFYYTIGDKLWGEYGFYDAFNPTEGWYANSYLAIDQGPIVVMIENFRTGLIWNLFMTAPEVQTAKDKLGFNN